MNYDYINYTHTQFTSECRFFFYSHIQTKKKLRIIRNTRVQHRAHGIYIVNACWYQKYFIFLIKLGHILKTAIRFIVVVVVDNACVLLIRDHISHHWFRLDEKKAKTYFFLRYTIDRYLILFEGNILIHFVWNKIKIFKLINWSNYTYNNLMLNLNEYAPWWVGWSHYYNKPTLIQKKKNKHMSYIFIKP